MKRMRIIVLLVIGCVVAFTACSPYPRESQRMAVAFEQAQLVYGEGENDTLLFIPELDKASAYYASKKDYGKAALAALFQGYAEKDYDKTLAMNAFKEAERYGELVNDSLTVARAQYQMGRMLMDDYMLNDALSLFIKADAYFGKLYSEKALVLNGEACSYLLQQQYDCADSCLNRAYYYAELGNSNKVKQKVLNNYSVLYQTKGDYSKAINYLRMVKPENSQQLLLNQLNLGNAFMALKEMDSAEYYYQKVEENLPSVDLREETKVAAYVSFSRFAENKKDYYLALQYRKTYDKLQHELQNSIERKNIFRIQKKYDYESIENEVKLLKIHSLHNLLILLTMILMAVIVIVIMVYRHKQIVRKEREIKMELDKVKHELLQSVDSSVVDEEILWRLHLILKIKQISERSNTTKSKQELMKQFILNGYDSLCDAAVSIINEAYPNLQTILQNQYPNLNETELKVCMLSIKGLSNSDMADILGVSVHTVNKSRSNLYKKMGVEVEAFKTTVRELKSSYQV